MVTGAKALNDQNKLQENTKNIPQTQNQNFTPGNQGYGISFENQQTFSQQYCLELADICLRFEDLSVRKSNVQSLPSMMCYHIACAAQVRHDMSLTVCFVLCDILCVLSCVFYCVFFCLLCCMLYFVFSPLCYDVSSVVCYTVWMVHFYLEVLESKCVCLSHLIVTIEDTVIIIIIVIIVYK